MTLAFSIDGIVGGTPTQADRLPGIGWHNLLLEGILSASSADGEHAAELAADGITSTAWQTEAASGPDHWLEVDLGDDGAADYAAIAAHTLMGATVVPQYHDGAAWQDAGASVVVTSNAPLCWTFPVQVASRWRLEITGAPDVISIAAVHIGQAFRPDTGLPVRWRPPSLNEDVEHESPISVGGQLLPRQIRRRGVEVRIDLPHLGFDLARDDWLDFVSAAQTRAFFFFFLFGDHAEVVYGGMVRHRGHITRAGRTDLSVTMRGIAR